MMTLWQALALYVDCEVTGQHSIVSKAINRLTKKKTKQRTPPPLHYANGMETNG